ncbi:phage tail sheath subtilisin-like domain-containing protein [Ihubacter sp. mB4P-1]|uniref:phage tail sheath subtilisin-like domain-containing protein n=1 Tax=Ihubacter sp. mB4P-1 TaxID=3242370 RepID=UPI001379BAC9
MAQIFREGEMKVRPDVYYRYSNRGEKEAGAVDGIVALAVKASWGPCGQARAFSSAAEVAEAYGDCDGTAMAEIMFAEGVNTIYMYRAGTGGAKASLTQGDNVVLTAKYEGSRPIKVKVLALPGGKQKQCLIIVDGKVKEVYTFTAGGTGEAAALAEALKASAYVTAEQGKTGAVEEFETALSGGADGSVTADDYLEAFQALEPYYYNVLCCDTNAEGVQNVLAAYVEEVVKTGKFPIAVMSANMTKPLADRMAESAAKNHGQIAMIGNTYTDLTGIAAPAIFAAAHLAGAVAATPANQSIVHKSLRGTGDVTERFTSAQYEEAIRNGLVLLSRSADGQVWFDSGVTTLVDLDESQDAGWKKLKRTKVRNELMRRLHVMMEKKIGKVSCDSDGIADVLQSGMRLLNDMAGEKKIMPGGSFTLDGSNPLTSDSAWFIVEADDIDTLEKIYLHYRFSNVQTA